MEEMTERKALVTRVRNLVIECASILIELLAYWDRNHNSSKLTKLRLAKGKLDTAILMMEARMNYKNGGEDNEIK